jgi:hypothetical protein
MDGWNVSKENASSTIKNFPREPVHKLHQHLALTTPATQGHRFTHISTQSAIGRQSINRALRYWPPCERRRRSPCVRATW